MITDKKIHFIVFLTKNSFGFMENGNNDSSKIVILLIVRRAIISSTSYLGVRVCKKKLNNYNIIKLQEEENWPKNGKK